MEITKKIFWREAAKGGTIIGLVVVGFSLLKYSIGLAEDVKFWGGFVSFLSFAMFVSLVYLFTKKISDSADPLFGFPFGKCVGFTVSMMLFVGFILGVYNAIMNIVINPETINSAIDTSMLIVQDTLGDAEFDRVYDMAHKMMFNPIYWLFSSIFGYVIYGAIVGLIVSAFTKRDPDMLAILSQEQQNEAAEEEQEQE